MGGRVLLAVNHALLMAVKSSPKAIGVGLAPRIFIHFDVDGCSMTRIFSPSHPRASGGFLLLACGGAVFKHGEKP